MPAKQEIKYPECHVLCLHGCNQNTEAFTGYLSNFSRILKKYNVVLHYLEAPYDHPRGGKTWLAVPLDIADIGIQKYDQETLEINKTLDMIHTEIVKNNVSILLGFSQGGNMVDLYLGYKNDDNMIKKGIVISGYYLVDADRKNNDTVSVLIIESDSDDIVKPEYSPQHYKNKETIKHDKGHKIPGSEILRKIADFIVE